MKALENKIKKEGKILPGDILKIDNFLNHQIDTKFIEELADEFKRLYKDENVTKILTVEASGIVVAYETAKRFNYCPVVFAKKGEAANMNKDMYSAPVYSYTRKREFHVNVSKQYLSSEDRVLLIDDFLANGEALGGLLNICQQAGCEVIGCGVVVEKGYQPGGEAIRKQGYRVESLARVKHMTDEGEIDFFTQEEK